MAKKIKATSINTTSGGNNNQFMILGGTIVLAVVAVVGFIIINQRSAGSAKTLDTNENYLGIPLEGEFSTVRTVERSSDVAESVTRGTTSDGFPYVGNLNAPIYIGEFADFTCPACAAFSDTAKQIIRDFARSGEIAYVYLPMPLQGHEPQATRAARAAICAVQQGGFWEMHDELFRIHLAESPGAFTNSRLESMANDIGLNGSELRSCVNTNFADTAIVNTRRLIQQYGVTGTPTMVYSLDRGLTWNTLPSSDGSTSGGRSYDSLAALIRNANQTGG